MMVGEQRDNNILREDKKTEPILRIPEAVLAEELLRDEKDSRYLTAEEVKMIVSSSIEIGKERAEALRDRPILERLENAHIKVRYIEPGEETFSDMNPYASVQEAQLLYRPGDVQIKVWMQPLRFKLKLLSNYMDITEDDLISLCLCHEYFHSLEFLEKKRVFDQCGTYTREFFPGLRRKFRLTSPSEIAAHSFARTYTGFLYSPEATDLLMLYQEERVKEDRLYDGGVYRV